jgi:hypothetical protein
LVKCTSKTVLYCLFHCAAPSPTTLCFLIIDGLLKSVLCAIILGQFVTVFYYSRGTWGTMEQKSCFLTYPQTYSIYFAETVFYMRCSMLLTFWYIDVLICSQQTSLEIINLYYVFCFIVPHWRGTMAQILGYSEKHYFLTITSYLLFESRFIRHKHRTKASKPQKAVSVLKM